MGTGDACLGANLLEKSMKPIRTIDGSRFTDIEGFYDEVERVLLDENTAWGRNLDAFHDILHGGWGTPAGNWSLRWISSGVSKNHLGETFSTLVEIISDRGPDSEIELVLD